VCGRLEPVCPSIRCFEIEPQLEFLLDQRPQFVKSRMAVGELIDSRSRVAELLLSMHLLQGLFQAGNFLMQRPDLMLGGVLLVALLHHRELFRRLA
jgi:hypothetical protein